MIEPLRFNEEKSPTFPIERPVWCEVCQATKSKRNNPNVADKYCMNCFQRRFLCVSCDDTVHRIGATRTHRRRIIVLGHGVRKNMKTRGDGVSFPKTLDMAQIKLDSKVYLEGKLINKEPPRYLNFMVGLSGATVHVQVLGARNLVAADMSGTSDPFIKALYCGRSLGLTRVRPRALNPKWDNETFIVPMDSKLPDPRNMPKSSKEMFKLEVYDYDWIGNNDFLGHFEVPRSKLYKMALAAKNNQVRFPLTLREFHGILGIQLGLCERYVHVKVIRAESLDNTDAFGASDPYVKAYMGNWFLGQTPHINDSCDPEWTVDNEFLIKINDFIKHERKILKKIKNRNFARSMAIKDNENNSEEFFNADPGDIDMDIKTFFKFDVFDYDRFTSHSSLGSSVVSIDIVRKMLPNLPKQYIEELPVESPEERLLLTKVLDTSIKQTKKKVSLFDRILKFCSLCINNEDDEGEEKDDDESDDLGEELYSYLPKPVEKIVPINPDDAVDDEEDDDDPIYASLMHQVKERVYESVGASDTTVGKKDKYSASNSPATVSPDISPRSSPYHSPKIKSNISPATNISITANESPLAKLKFENISFLKNNSLEERINLLRSPNFNMIDSDGNDKAEEFIKETVDILEKIVKEDDAKDIMDESSQKNTQRNRNHVQLNIGHTIDKDLLSSSLVDFSQNASQKAQEDENMENRKQLLDELKNELRDYLDPKQKRHRGAKVYDGVKKGNDDDDDDSASDDDSSSNDDSDSDDDNDSENGDEDVAPIVRGRRGAFDDGSKKKLDKKEKKRKNLASKNNKVHQLSKQYSMALIKDPLGVFNRQFSVAFHKKFLDAKNGKDDDEEEDKEASKKLSIFTRAMSTFNFTPNKSNKKKDILSRQMSLGTMLSKNSKNAKPRKSTTWSKLRHFAVEQTSTNNVAEPEKKERGYIVARLLISTRGNVITGLDEGVRTMTVGETSDLKIRFDYAYGNYCMGSNIPPRANIVFRVTLMTLNGKGRLGVIIRQIRRFLRNFIKVYRLFRNCLRYIHRDATKHKRCISFFRWLCTKKMIQESSEDEVADLIDDVSKGDFDEESHEDDMYDIPEEEQVEIKVEPRMRKIVNATVKSGSKYLWDWKPENRKKTVSRPHGNRNKLDGTNSIDATNSIDGVNSIDDGNSLTNTQEENVSSSNPEEYEQSVINNDE